MSSSKSHVEDTVEIELDGERITLRPTLEAAMLVDTQFGGYTAAFQALLNHSLSAAITIISAGSGRSVNNDLRAKVYQHGVRNLVGPLSRFVTILANGGREPSGDDDEGASSGK
ncbi:hypothetical protein [Rhodoligotrophos ferricapiens]|uniref:hypothetical protein n=1 Tax=Rhodoligotrophos ferricapiens TaxID=3069264 RepID=UPI00315C676C